MKKQTLFAIIIILYLLTPVCLLSALGTMVSKKFEVDESYWRIDGNNRLSAREKEEKINSLDRKGRQMEYKAYILAFLAFVTFVTATGLLIKRNKLLRNVTNNT